MPTMIETIRAFAHEFQTIELYDTGWAEPWLYVMKSEDREAMARALVYVIGYANAVRIQSAYMSKPWHRANLVGIAAGTFLCMLDAGDEAEKAARCIVTYRAELRAEVD